MPPALKPFAFAVQAISRRLVGQRTASKADLTRIRSAMLERVLDCELKTVRRIRVQLAGASSAVQLWLLRSEVYKAVSEQFGQAEASAHRIAAAAVRRLSARQAAARGLKAHLPDDPAPAHSSSASPMRRRRCMAASG